MAIYNSYHTNEQSTEVALNQIRIPANTPPSLSTIPHYCLAQNVSTYCNYHWHVHADIFVNSTSYIVIPNELEHINNQEYELYAIHTHDYSGIIHIEWCNPSENFTFTLGDIFEVWGYPIFNSTRCLTNAGNKLLSTWKGLSNQETIRASR
jgi:hypothetical protein